MPDARYRMQDARCQMQPANDGSLFATILFHNGSLPLGATVGSPENYLLPRRGKGSS